MREIKFRAFFKGEMNYPVVSHKYANIIFWSSPQVAVNSLDREKMQIMQYTGLKDKSGREIYEGDIMKGIHRNQDDEDGNNAYEVKDRVELRNGGFRWNGKCMQDGYTKENNVLYQFMWVETGHFSSPSRYYQIDEIEVIGNIHENPTLLP